MKRVLCFLLSLAVAGVIGVTAGCKKKEEAPPAPPKTEAPAPEAPAENVTAPEKAAPEKPVEEKPAAEKK